MDMAIKNSVKRKMNWHVEKKDCEKDLITTLGTVYFMKTLYEMCIRDRIKGLRNI